MSNRGVLFANLADVDQAELWVKAQKEQKTIPELRAHYNIRRTCDNSIRRFLKSKGVEIARCRASTKKKTSPEPKEAVVRRDPRHVRAEHRRELLAWIVAAKEVLKNHNKEWFERREFRSAKDITCELNAQLEDQGESTVSRSTVRRDLADMGFYAYVRPIRSAQLSLANHKQRFEFCEKVLGGRNSSYDWERFCFTDEKWFNCNDHGDRWEFRRPEDEPTPRFHQQKAPSLLIFGAIALGHKFPLIILDDPDLPKKDQVRRQTSKSYVDKVLKKMKRQLVDNDLILVQDQASSHTATESLKYLGDNNIEYVPDYPARSPTLNPIEQVWALVAQKVGGYSHTTDHHSLKRAVLRAWRSIDQSVIDSFISNYEQRCQQARDISARRMVEIREYSLEIDGIELR